MLYNPLYVCHSNSSRPTLITSITMTISTTIWFHWLYERILNHYFLERGSISESNPCRSSVCFRSPISRWIDEQYEGTLQLHLEDSAANQERRQEQHQCGYSRIDRVLQLPYESSRLCILLASVSMIRIKMTQYISFNKYEYCLLLSFLETGWRSAPSFQRIEREWRDEVSHSPVESVLSED